MARLPSKVKILGKSELYESINVVLQFTYKAYCSGIFSFQSILIVVPLFDADVRYDGSPHFRVSSISQTPTVLEATSRIIALKNRSFSRTLSG